MMKYNQTVRSNVYCSINLCVDMELFIVKKRYWNTVVYREKKYVTAGCNSLIKIKEDK